MPVLGSTVHAEGRELRAAVGVLTPYAFADETQGGLLPDAFALLSNRLGQPIRLSRVTYRRMQYMLEKGDVDLAILIRSAQSEQTAQPIVKFAISPLVVLGLKGTSIQSMDDIGRLRLAAMRGGQFEKILGSANGNLLLTHDFRLAAGMLQGGRVDAVGGPVEGLLRALQDEGLGADAIGDIFVVKEMEIWLHVSRRSAYLADHEAIMRAAESMVEDGSYQAIRQRYLKSDLLEKAFGPLVGGTGAEPER